MVSILVLDTHSYCINHIPSNQQSLFSIFWARHRIFRSPGRKSTALQRASFPPAQLTTTSTFFTPTGTLAITSTSRRWLKRRLLPFCKISTGYTQGTHTDREQPSFEAKSEALFSNCDCIDVYKLSFMPTGTLAITSTLRRWLKRRLLPFCKISTGYTQGTHTDREQPSFEAKSEALFSNCDCIDVYKLSFMPTGILAITSASRRWLKRRLLPSCEKINRSHKHTHTDREQHPRHRHRRFIIQRGHEHTRTANWSESGFGSLRGAPSTHTRGNKRGVLLRSKTV